ncbi:MAG: hypothetical protein KatS3mg060_2127 [Dehalococcoidia bacterium]|jgi:polyisoprenoid-binding protein YceI|nr:MAG: hypothetical protein KatS3mg060_2127 [Dehalococcoidia bacterium]
MMLRIPFGWSTLVTVGASLALVACTLEAGTVTEPVAGSVAAPAVAVGEGATRYTIVAGEARYRVTEQLAGRNLPNDAVGVTSQVTGAVVRNADGTIAAGSQLVVNLTSLTSDSSQRDSFIKRNTLQTDQYPTATFHVREVRGLPATIPASGSTAVEVLGDLTIHGVTRPATWTGTLTFTENGLTGSLATTVTLADFGMTAPRVPLVLSIDETIHLELDVTAQAG